jgi:hypothetical protein
VLSPSYAKESELKSDWYEVPQSVVVPPENYFYAVDQKELDKDYRGQNNAYRIDKERQVAFQLHKWLYNMPLPNDEKQIAEIGEWVVAERVPVARGEYMGRHQFVQVPVWKADHEAFVLMSDPRNRDPRTNTLVPVDFSQPDGTDLVLVDFAGGEAKYERAGKSPVADKAATEVLVMSPDGKLLAHDSASDVKNDDRKKRLEAYRTRVKDVRSGKANDKGGGDSANPFGPGGKGGGPP